jgi:hypothetical protein
MPGHLHALCRDHSYVMTCMASIASLNPKHCIKKFNSENCKAARL